MCEKEQSGKLRLYYLPGHLLPLLSISRGVLAAYESQTYIHVVVDIREKYMYSG